MTTAPACLDARAALKAFVIDGAEPSAEALAHWKACPDCRSLAAAVTRQLETLGEDAPSPLAGVDTMALDLEVKRQARRRLWMKAAALGALGLVAGAGTMAALGVEWAGWSWAVAAGVVALIGLVGLLTVLLARTPARHRLYRRLGPARMVSGVCAGLAERTATPVWAWRLGCVAGLFLASEVVVLYFLLAFTMPVHPEDRAGLLRFRVVRFFRRLLGRPEGTAA
jgi:phage shock protein PspC (stress-responsive transcriptional regulator)